MYRDHPLRDSRPITPLSIALNILWLAFGGALSAIGWFIAAFIMVITIIGIPFARVAFDNGVYTLWPFGAKPMLRDHLEGRDNDPDPFRFLGNIIWFALAGWWLAIGHAIAALGLAITIIGLPFAWAHLKLAGYALWPFGRAVVSAERERSLAISSR